MRNLGINSFYKTAVEFQQLIEHWCFMKKRESTPQKNYTKTITRKAQVRINEKSAIALSNGHPWVYRNGLIYDEKKLVPGQIYSLYDSKGRFVAKGVNEAAGAIVFRIVTRSQHDKTDDTFFKKLAFNAFESRSILDKRDLDVYRIVNSEGDRLPGFTVTRFGDFLLCIQYMKEVDHIVEAVLPELLKLTGLKGVYKQERFRPSGDSSSKRDPGRKFLGEDAPLEVEVVEDGAKFLVDITAPMGVGFFPDYRNGRRLIRQLAPGRRVLNLFSHTGAFTVAALTGGASEVISVDLSQRANTRAMKNCELNGFDRSQAKFMTEDIRKAITILARRRERFDMAIIDPPTFSKGKSNVWSVRKDYQDLVQELLTLMEPGSIVLFTSNTAKMTMEEFESSIAMGSWSRTLRILERISLPFDYPELPGFPDGSYLKSLLVRVD
jgi:23S rRNA (cytosine1962-C5)-methyltransferase